MAPLEVPPVNLLVVVLVVVLPHRLMVALVSLLLQAPLQQEILPQ